MESSRVHHRSGPADLKAAARSIWEAALASVQPPVLIEHMLALGRRELVVAGEAVPLAPGGRLRLVAIGKAAESLARAAIARLGDRHTDGLIVTKEGHVLGPPLPRVEVIEASHPLPDERSARAAARIAAFLRGGWAEDVIVLLVSGGTSALVAAPRPPLVLEDVEQVTDLLLKAGADIHDLNTVRRHIDRLKGGGLLRIAAPARVVALLLSDVIGDAPATIGSGIAAADATTHADALAALARHGLAERIPVRVRELLERGVRGEEPETLKPGDPLLAQVMTRILGSGAMAVAAAAAAAEALGFKPFVLATDVAGEARDVGRAMAARAQAVRERGDPAPPPVALLWAGETTVTVRGQGRGGRNQELALAAALALAGTPRLCLVSLGTDGTDGPTDAAGAIVDGDTVHAAARAGVDLAAALSRNDSYHALAALGSLIHTGPTGTHVNDIGFALIGAGG